jgi:uncharacterized membrane protein
MSASRLEAFSDAVIAIIITIMVLEIRPPHEASLSAWIPVLPHLLAYVLSFFVLAAWWNNHHHLLRATHQVSPGVMWTNMLYLFSLSLVPIATTWLGEYPGETWPVVLYSFVQLLAGTSYLLLVRAIIRADPATGLVRALGRDIKGKVSAVLFVAAIVLAFVNPYISYILLASTIGIWLVPDRRLVGA